MKKLLLTICVLSSLAGVSQDIHFSQFNVAPMVYNPALAGGFEGDMRFIGNQRTQWRSVTAPYSTIGVSADFNHKNQPLMGSAFSIYQDRAGDSKLNTIAVNGAFSYEIAKSADELHTFTLGGQLGFTHRKIDYSDLNYDSQWNGFQYNANASSGEQFARDARTYVNFNLGGAWQYRVNKRNSMEAGIALFNASGPQQSFFDDPSIRRDMRVSISGSGIIELNDEWDAIGGLLFSVQGKYLEFIPGGGARYILEDERGSFKTLFGGMYYRTKDAGFIMAGMDYDQWRVGLSYDINLSNLRPASNGRGGFELSVVYILTRFVPPPGRKRICPEYF